MKPVDIKRMSRLLRATQAGMRLRETMVDGGAHCQMLSVPRASVDAYDGIIKALTAEASVVNKPTNGH